MRSHDHDSDVSRRGWLAYAAHADDKGNAAWQYYAAGAS